MQKQCLVYVRVSTAEQASVGHHSLAAQEELCRRHASSLGFEVLEVLRDEGFSGRTKDRAGFSRLMEFTAAPDRWNIGAVLVQDTSRLARNSIEYLLFRRELESRGVSLISVTQPHLDDSPEGRLMDTIVAGINQYQSEEKGRRVVIAMRKRFEEGWWPSLAPLGYRNVVRGGQHIVVPDNDRFNLITLAFEEYATGRYRQDELSRLLQGRGLRGRQGSPLSRITLNYLLANPFYFGQMEWGGIVGQGNHRPATTKEIWDQCQAVTKEHNRTGVRKRKHDFLLTGLTRCGVCLHLHTRTVNRAKDKRYYHCASRLGCRQPYVPADQLEAQIRTMLPNNSAPQKYGSIEEERWEIQRAFRQFIIKNREIVQAIAA